LKGRDGSIRDLAGIHGTYRKVAETIPAVRLLGDYLDKLGPGPCTWYLDSPVSNSGRLRGVLLDIARETGRDWQVELVFNPDPILEASEEIVATAASAILNRCEQWFPLASVTVNHSIPGAFVVDLESSSIPPPEPPAS